METCDGSRRTCTGRRCVPLVLVGVLLWAVLAYAGPPTCSLCGRQIAGKYLVADDKHFCGKECYEKTLPPCDVCGKRLTGKYVTAGTKRFCSGKCFESQLPTCEICARPLRQAVLLNGHVYCERHANRPACSSCLLPMTSGDKLPDGRMICNKCRPSVIVSADEGNVHYLRAQQEVLRVTGLRSVSRPPLELVGLEQMPQQRKIGNARLVQRGQYRRTTNTQTKTLLGWTLSETSRVREGVLILYGLLPGDFLATAAHELTHDLLAEFFPQVAESGPAWLEEGVCQYVAAIVCRRNGFTAQVEDIENCRHPENGDGYRYCKKRFGDDDWRKCVEWLRRVDLKELPRKL